MISGRFTDFRVFALVGIFVYVAAKYPYYFFHGHFCIRTPLILYNADKCNAKKYPNFWIREQNCPRCVRDFLKESPENTP